jgi:O-antigen ligase
MTKSFYSLALFLLGGVAFVVPNGFSYGFYLLCLMSLLIWLKRPTPLIPKEVRHFLWPLLTYAFVHCLMALNEQLLWREIDPYLPFVLIVFGVWGIRRYRPSADWFWLGLALGSVGAAIFSGYQHFVLGVRAGGYTNPIQFGNIALLFGVLCMIRGMVIPGINGLNILMWLGFLAGLAASVWSQTRGGWLAVILIFVWILLNVTKDWKPIKRINATLVIVACLAIPSLQPGGVIQTRMTAGALQLKEFFETGEQNNSVGIRIALWAVGLEGFKAAPMLGQGNQGWVSVRDQAIEDGRLASFASKFSHLHNEYLNVAFKRGLFGLFFYMLMFLVPMFLFFRPYIKDPSPQIRALAIAGMVTPMMFMDFALTQSFLTHNSGRMVLCGVWMSLAGLMLNALKIQVDQNNF